MAVAGPEPSRVRIGLAIALVALTVVVFLPILGHAWLNYDDDLYITANPDLARGLSWDGVTWAFSTFQGANWFPLTWLSWLLDFELWGLSAPAFHATNLALHTADTLLLFLALTRLSGSAGRSAFVAAVFAVHPLHVEAVAWAAVRKDPLAALFFVLALWVWGRAGARPRSARDLISVSVLLALGLMAKPVLVTLPAVLLLLDEWPLRRLRRDDAPERWDPGRVRRALVEKIPLVGVVSMIGAVALLAQQRGGTVAALQQLPLPARAGNALVSYLSYLRQAFWPSDLAVFYPHPGEALPAWKVAGAAALLVALTAGALGQLRRRPYLAVGWLWYLGMLVPMIGLVQVGSQARADRYTYLPLIGIAICVAWGVPDLLRAWKIRDRAVAALGAVAVVALAIVASLQVGHWRDSRTLFEHALRVTTRNHIAHAHLGSALQEEGEARQTVAHFRKALAIEPRFARAANNLAWILATHPEPSLRDPRTAVRLARRASEDSEPPDASILDTLAAALAADARFDAAVATAERAAQLAEREGQAGLAEEIRSRLELYRTGRPYRERSGRERPGAPAGGSPP